jgi:pSer/pThr/pTyr-binding forkhead associated (FHA) protein
MGILLVNEYGRDTREVPIRQDLVRIGRDPRGEVVLGDAGVSRAHARILCGGGEVLVEDLGSRNGTLVNDRKLGAREPFPLRHGDIVRVGRSVIQLILRISRKITGRPPRDREARPREIDRDIEGEGEEGRAPARSLFHLRGLEPRLLVVPTRGMVSSHELHSDRVRIGRGSDEDIVLDDPTVSERHAEIVYTSDGFHVVDRDSAAGTFLDGAPVRVSPLGNRGYLRFGKLKALFVVRERGKEPPEAGYGLRDRLIERHPERAAEIQGAFRHSREGSVDFAEELIRRGALDPEEWWDASRDASRGFREETLGDSRRWISLLAGWARRRKA